MTNSLVLMIRSLFVAFILFFSAFSQPLNSQNLLPGIPEHASYSLLIRNLNSRQDIIACNEEKALISASLMKLVTTATALELLGSDYKFTTDVFVNGKVQNGVLYGDLVIQGGGDPTLGSRYFAEQSPETVLAKIRTFLMMEGISDIDGLIVIENKVFDPFRFPSKRLWEDMGNYYGAAPDGVTWRDNSFEVVLRSPATPGQLCSIVDRSEWLEPLAFDVYVKSASHNKDSAYIYGVPGLNEWEIRGSIPADRNFFPVKGALPHPGVSLGREIANLLADNKAIPVKEVRNYEWTDARKKIGTIRSPKLKTIIRETNQKSINLFADHLLLTLGLRNQDSSLSVWDNGLLQIKQFWSDKTKAYLSADDGSGLAPQNKISSRFLVEMLEFMYNQGESFADYRNSLSQNGGSGTLKYMWQKPALVGKIYGKSGSMNDVVGYAGYYFPDTGDPLAFSVIVNHHGMENHEVRKIIEASMESLLLKN